MSRSYKSRAKSHRVYSVDEVLKHYSICRNTLSNWRSSGLQPSPVDGPQLFRGGELNRFHEDRKARNRKNLRLGQFYCTGCKAGVFPSPGSVSFLSPPRGGALGFADCPDCGGRLSKILGETECDEIRTCRKTNTSLHEIDEGKGEVQVGIGTKAPFGVWLEPTVNDKILHMWQLYAGRYDIKTTDAHLASIRDFEAFFDNRCFSKTSDQDASLYRNILLEKGGLPREEGGLSSSTIRHRASQLISFFNWLMKQDGYRRLSANIPDQFDLPKRQLAKVLPRNDKLYPTLEEARNMVARMPRGTQLQRRDQALVALAFLTALRAGALVTLRLKHLDIEARTVTQDGSEMRAKNGKSFVVQWFPGVEEFEPYVTDWASELHALGYEGRDALFPHASDLKRQRHQREPVPVLNTNGPVNRAFKIASQGIGKSFSPHSARHFIKALGDRACSSPEERKAWSQNMGHENEAITEMHYAKMTTESRMQILADVGCHHSMSQTAEWDSDKELMLQYLFGELPKGSPEYLRGKALARLREDARDAGSLIE